MRKAFDANVPKLKPRLKAGVPAASAIEELDEAPIAVSPVRATATPSPSTPTATATATPTATATATPTRRAAQVQDQVQVQVQDQVPVQDVLLRKERLDKIKR